LDDKGEVVDRVHNAPVGRKDGAQVADFEQRPARRWIGRFQRQVLAGGSFGAWVERVAQRIAEQVE
jgi:hypothetical protein